jgi:membrane associated rhomboid family serine protease
VITIALIAINLFVYFAVQPHSSDQSQVYLYHYAAVPCEVTTRQPVTEADIAANECDVNHAVVVRTDFGLEQVPDTPAFPAKNVYLAILFSMFLHASVLHVLGNMLFLWIFGNNIEDRMGPVWYLAFYLAAGVVAAFTYIGLNSHSVQPLLGASGAIAGVMGAYIIWFPRTRVLTLVGFFPVYLPAVAVLGLWFLLQFSTNPNEGVAWQAHVGGFVVGALVALLLRPFFKPKQPKFGSPYDDWDGGYGGGYPGRL